MNSIIARADRNAESYRVLTNDERLASWAAKFFAAGHHHRQQKPRVRVTVPAAKAA